jgi:hypothetical protein
MVPDRRSDTEGGYAWSVAGSTVSALPSLEFGELRVSRVRCRALVCFLVFEMNERCINGDDGDLSSVVLVMSFMCSWIYLSARCHLPQKVSCMLRTLNLMICFDCCMVHLTPAFRFPRFLVFFLVTLGWRSVFGVYPRCYIRGNSIRKYLRIPDEVIDLVSEEQRDHE